MLADDGLRHRTGLFNGNALGEGFSAADDILASDCQFHCGVEFGLHTDDGYIRAHVTRDGGDTAHQPATANWNQQDIKIRLVG